VSIRDWLGSTPRNAIVAAIAPGQAALFSAPSSTVETVVDPEVEMSSTGGSVTIRGANTDGDPVEATLPTHGDRRVETRGQVGDLRLLRISVEEDDVTFENGDDDSAGTGDGSENADNGNGGGGEGEAAAASELAIEPASLGSSSLTLGETQAEGESPAAASVTRADLFVPSGGAGSRVDSAVLALEQGSVWEGQSKLKTAAGRGDESRPTSVDRTMPDVAESLSIQSRSGDAIAEESLKGSHLAVDAIDAALSEDLN
jgi:hypothetical protein